MSLSQLPCCIHFQDRHVHLPSTGRSLAPLRRCLLHIGCEEALLYSCGNTGTPSEYHPYGSTRLKDMVAQLCLSAIYCGSMFRAYALAAFGRTTTAAWSKYQACTWQQVSGDAQRPHTFLIPLYTRYGLVGLAPAPTHLDPSEGRGASIITG